MVERSRTDELENGAKANQYPNAPPNQGSDRDPHGFRMGHRYRLAAKRVENPIQ